MTTVSAILLALFHVPLFWLKVGLNMLLTGPAGSIMPNSLRPRDSAMSMIAFWPFSNCLKLTKEFCILISIFIMAMVLKRLSTLPTES